MYIISSSEGNEQYGYDVKGNRTVQLSTASSPHTDSMEYRHDGANQLKQVTRNGFTTSYKYDGDGLMREKNDDGTTRYYYDGNDIWGNPTVKEEADQYTNPFRYSGEYWDEGQSCNIFVHAGMIRVSEDLSQKTLGKAD